MFLGRALELDDKLPVSRKLPSYRTLTSAPTCSLHSDFLDKIYLASTIMSDWLVTDDLTVVLGLVLGAVVLLGNLYKPQSLVHPILLGRQSDVDRVRKKEESAVYRNYSTGLVGRVRRIHISQRKQIWI